MYRTKLSGGFPILLVLLFVGDRLLHLAAASVAENTAEAGQDGSLQGTISPDIGIGSGAITQQKCPNPPTVAGARIALAVEIVFGGVQMKVSYTCTDQEAILSGLPTLICGPDSGYAWPDDVPSCIEGELPTAATAVDHTSQTDALAPTTAARIPCPAPPSHANAQMIAYTDTSIKYNCSEGYAPSGARANTLSVECDLSTGMWSTPSWHCLEIDCGPPFALPNATIRYQTTTFGSGALYLCLRGSVLLQRSQTFASSTCQATGQWSKVAFTCKYIDCGSPPEAPGVNYTLSTTFFGSKATMQCVEGYSYRLRDSMKSHELAVSQSIDFARLLSLTCQHNRTWTEAAAVCEPDACKAAPQVPQAAARVSVQRDEHPNYGIYSIAQYECETGFVLIGTASRFCYWNSTWAATDISCMMEALPCPEPPYIPSAEYRRFPGQPGSPDRVAYTCREGNVGIGVATATCMSGAWTELTLQCNTIRCDDPPSFQDSKAWYVSVEYDSTATYQCNDGFTGQQQVWTCGLDGLWKGEEPTCQESGCDAPLPVLHSYVQITTGNKTSDSTPVLNLDHSMEYAVGTVLHYQCANGLVLLGASRRTCQRSQLWSGGPPRCLRLTCPKLMTPANGHVEVTGYKIGSTAIFSCNDDYTLNGQATLRCGPGRWLGTAPSCSYALPKVIAEAVLGRGAKRNRNATIHGYVGTNRAYLQCIVAGGQPEPEVQWERLTGQKKLNAKIRKQETKSGRKTLRAVFKPLLVSHSGIWRCTAQNAFGEAHADIKLFVYLYCGSPPRVTAGHIVSLANTGVGRPSKLEAAENRTKFLFNEQISYHCHSGHVLIGSRLRTCQADGSWSGSTSACFRRTCGKPAVPPNGYVNGTMYRYSDQVRYGCLTGYRLLGRSSRRCLSTGKWSGSAPSCRILDCGPPKTMPNTVTSGHQFTYGSSVTVQCSNGYIGADRSSHQGSIKCSHDNQWRGVVPNCTLIQCIAPALPRNGYITYESSTAPRPVKAGAVLGFQQCVQYMCRPGYSLIGVQRRCCNEVAEWTGDPPQCKAWCDSVSCQRGEKCVADLNLKQAHCQCFKENDDCRHQPPQLVCGSDGVTYASQCSLDGMACRRGNASLFKENNGVCPLLYKYQTHCQCSLLVREPTLLDCIRSSWTMLVRIVAASRIFYRVFSYRVYSMGRKVLQAKRMYKVHRVMASNDCSCPALQVGQTYLLSGLEGHDIDTWQLIVTSYSYARQQQYPRDVATIQWPCS